jgi:hypothetical protein
MVRAKLENNFISAGKDFHTLKQHIEPQAGPCLAVYRDMPSRVGGF